MPFARPKPPLLHPASRGKSYGRDAEDIDIDLAYAIGEYRRTGAPIHETLEALARARWT